ncbi:MAG TPA: hypothetical protein VEO01_28640 [Pseudonocardiaceae bacterium]|nr:hypothetical protein [Pseudonocardiaceae bacterium]
MLVLLGNGQEVKATRRFAQTLADRPGPRVVVWSEEDVQPLMSGQAGTPTTAMSADNGATRSAAESSVLRHVGKFSALWAWLRDQTVDQLPVTFNEIEEIVGVPLPASCRRHPAHWSSYDGSAVARAIQDAGWAATKVDLKQQRLVLVQLKFRSLLLDLDYSGFLAEPVRGVRIRDHT